MLQAMERRGLLRSSTKGETPHIRREYRATPAGRRALEAAKSKLKELFYELLEEEH
jgi:DNA-binding PadR family transcriptional regulator